MQRLFHGASMSPVFKADRGNRSSRNRMTDRSFTIDLEEKGRKELFNEKKGRNEL